MEASEWRLDWDRWAHSYRKPRRPACSTLRREEPLAWTRVYGMDANDTGTCRIEAVSSRCKHEATGTAH